MMHCLQQFYQFLIEIFEFHRKCTLIQVMPHLNQQPCRENNLFLYLLPSKKQMPTIGLIKSTIFDNKITL